MSMVHWSAFLGLISQACLTHFSAQVVLNGSSVTEQVFTWLKIATQLAR